MTIARVGVWVCSPTKLKIPKAEQETAQPTAARFNKLSVNLVKLLSSLSLLFSFIWEKNNVRDGKMGS